VTERPDLPEAAEQSSQSEGEPQSAAAPPADGQPGGPPEDHGPAHEGTPLGEGEAAAPVEDGLGDELAEARRALGELTTDLKRLQAEYLNYKRRVDRDRELVRQNATFSVLSELLPVMDSIDRAREHGELDPGFKAVADALETAVTKLGLTKFGEPGEEFDPNQHEALMHGHSPDVTTTTVDVVAQAGYRIGERVVRPARVTVLDPEA
jgi:molecular chaperone GrpE